MRLWSVHPKYLDTRGLVALWREALLAQAVLRGRTNGYTSHPQLQRFRAQSSPLGAIADYLRCVHAEAVSRGYAFALRKVSLARGTGVLTVTRGYVLVRCHDIERAVRALREAGHNVSDAGTSRGR